MVLWQSMMKIQYTDLKTETTLLYYLQHSFCMTELIMCIYVHQTAMTLKPPAQYCVDHPCAAKTALTCRVMDSTRPLKTSDQTCLSSQTHR